MYGGIWFEVELSGQVTLLLCIPLWNCLFQTCSSIYQATFPVASILLGSERLILHTWTAHDISVGRLKIHPVVGTVPV